MQPASLPKSDAVQPTQLVLLFRSAHGARSGHTPGQGNTEQRFGGHVDRTSVDQPPLRPLPPTIPPPRGDDPPRPQPPVHSRILRLSD
ncbi:hypothetical protein BJY01DRAFT_219540 [Aspergillus pseudoustus]|uniref:Uncharacterized protein n=1 Tax=Aspergillus pseudoustus TaxID=1810923 RepID=A0ABR4JG13_9EURO